MFHSLQQRSRSSEVVSLAICTFVLFIGLACSAHASSAQVLTSIIVTPPMGSQPLTHLAIHRNTAKPAPIIPSRLPNAVQLGGSTLLVAYGDGLPSMHTFAAGLQMISAPVDDDGLTFVQIFDQPVKIAHWSPSKLQYVVSPTPPADTLRPAFGYWARFTQPTNLISVGVVTDPSLTYSFALDPGWNLIGNPRQVAVPETGVTIVNGSTRLTFSQAASQNLIGNQVYTFGPGDVKYEMQADPSISFAPYAGYWIYVLQPVTITFPATGQ